MEDILRFLGKHFSLDYIIVPTFLWFYYRAPLRRIDDTAVIMTAYGKNGEAWKQRMLRQYWRPPALCGAATAASILFITYVIDSPPHTPERWITATAMIIWFIMIAIWPFVFCVRANRAYYALENWRQADLERRIAAGIANSNDIHGYIQGVKKREFNRGFAAGQSSEWNNH